jgi:hypothetical protein
MADGLILNLALLASITAILLALIYFSLRD